jgi:hypothetical protein
LDQNAKTIILPQQAQDKQMENSKKPRPAVSCSEYPHTECCTPQYWQAIRIASDWSMTCPSRRAARWLSSGSSSGSSSAQVRKPPLF